MLCEDTLWNLCVPIFFFFYIFLEHYFINPSIKLPFAGKLMKWLIKCWHANKNSTRKVYEYCNNDDDNKDIIFPMYFITIIKLMVHMLNACHQHATNWNYCLNSIRLDDFFLQIRWTSEHVKATTGLQFSSLRTSKWAFLQILKTELFLLYSLHEYQPAIITKKLCFNSNYNSFCVCVHTHRHVCV